MTREETLNNRSGAKALIRLGSDCNNNCLFCHARGGDAPEKNLKYDEAASKIKLASELGAGMVVFSGGEPTVRKDLFDLFETAASEGLNAGLITNGRMFYYREFADRLVEAGLKYVLVSLHGAAPETHDALAGAKSFEQTLTGIKRLSGRVGDLVVNTVLTRKNAKELLKLTSILKTLGPLRHKISLPEPKGAIMDNFSIALPPQAAAEIVRKFVAARGNIDGVSAGFDGFTPCMLDDYFFARDDFFTNGFYLVSEAGEDGFSSPTHGARSWLPECLFCSLYHLCPGIYSEYLGRFPDTTVAPLTQTVSNNIRFDLVSVVEIRGGENLCGNAALRVADPARSAAVLADGQLEIYETREFQTDNLELNHIKRVLEQIYVPSGKAETDGCHPAHLKKLRLSRECSERCQTRTCPGVFEVAEPQPWDAMESRDRETLSLLKGRVFEAGFGAGTHFELIRSKIKSGEIEFYLGADPDCPEAALSGSGERFELMKIGLEELEWSGEKFDAALLHRSYHHLRDLGLCLEKIAKMLRPGGFLAIAEDCKHIELVKASSVDKDPGDEANRGFEHYRNHTARDAAKAVEKFGFEAKTIIEVSRESGSHWTVIAEKTTKRDRL